MKIFNTAKNYVTINRIIEAGKSVNQKPGSGRNTALKDNRLRARVRYRAALHKI
jgi:hypothetical protein